MFYSYDCYLDNKYVKHGNCYASSEKEAYQIAFYNNNEKYEIRNVKVIRNNDGN